MRKLLLKTILMILLINIIFTSSMFSATREYANSISNRGFSGLVTTAISTTEADKIIDTDRSNYGALTVPFIAGSRYVEVQFPSNIVTNDIVYIDLGKYNPSNTLLGALLGTTANSLSTSLSSLEFTFNFYNGTTKIGSDISKNATNLNSNMYVNSDSNLIVKFKYLETGNSNRFRIGITGSGLLSTLFGGTVSLNIYNVYKESGSFGLCDLSGVFTQAKNTGLSASLLSTPPYNNLHRSIDGKPETYSTLGNTTLGTVDVGTTISQSFYYGTPITNDNQVSLRFKPGGSILSLDVLNSYNIIVYAGTATSTYSVSSLIDIDLLYLFTGSSIINVNIPQQVNSIDSITFQIVKLLGVDVLSAPTQVYGINVTPITPLVDYLNEGCRAATVNAEITNVDLAAVYKWYKVEDEILTLIDSGTSFNHTLPTAYGISDTFVIKTSKCDTNYTSQSELIIISTYSEEESITVGCSPLSSKNIDFKGVQHDDYVYLTWNDQYNEGEEKQYTVYSSIDAINFTPLDFNIYAGKEKNLYCKDITNYNSNTIYYKLKTTSNYSESFSEVIKIKNNNNNNLITTYPNPAENIITVKGTKPNYKIVVYDQLGIRKDIIECSKTYEKIDIASYLNGNYFIIILDNNNKNIFHTSFIKK